MKRAECSEDCRLPIYALRHVSVDYKNLKHVADLESCAHQKTHLHFENPGQAGSCFLLGLDEAKRDEGYDYDDTAPPNRLNLLVLQ